MGRSHGIPVKPRWTWRGLRARFRGRFSEQQIWLAAGLLVLLVLAGFAGWRWSQKADSRSKAGTQVAPVEDNAYALYRRAREDLDHSDRAGNVDAAIKLLERAVNWIPSPRPATLRLSEAYANKNIFNPDPQWTKLAAEYANKAITVDSYLAAGHVSLGMAKMNGR